MKEGYSNKLENFQQDNTLLEGIWQLKYKLLHYFVKKLDIYICKFVVYFMEPNLESVIKKLQFLSEMIKQQFKAEIIGVFGSFARDEQTSSSDLDILVRFFKGATLLSYVGLANFLEEELKRKVDVVSEKAVREELKEQIFNEVVQL